MYDDYTSIGTSKNVEHADEAFSTTLRDVLGQRQEVRAAKSRSVGSEKGFKEILNYHLIIREPRQRLLWNSTRFNLPGAVARFIWMMGANNRLKDIEFYWGARVTRFSDDGIIVPGSSYGERMLHPRPGVDQVEGIIKRLGEDPSSRRAAISIYQAEDAVRESGDIPCAFGLFYHIRNGALHASVVMRSNNAFILLPYNLFEFSLLAEAIASELHVTLGSLSYNAVSMHVYEDNYADAEKAANAVPFRERIAIPEIPFDPSPIEQIKELVKLEAEARHAASGFTNENFEEWIQHGERKLSHYWRQYYFLLLLHMASKRRVQNALDQLQNMLEAPWKDYLPPNIFITESQSGIAGIDLFGQSSGGIQINLQGSELYTQRLNSLEEHCKNKSRELQGRSASPISFQEYVELRKSLVGEPNEPLAQAAKDLPLEISQEDFDEALQLLRKP